MVLHNFWLGLASGSLRFGAKLVFKLDDGVRHGAGLAKRQTFVLVFEITHLVQSLLILAPY